MNSFLLLAFLWETDVISSQDSLFTGGKKWRMIQGEWGAELLNVGPGAGFYLGMRSALFWWIPVARTLSLGFNLKFKMVEVGTQQDNSVLATQV